MLCIHPMCKLTTALIDRFHQPRSRQYSVPILHQRTAVVMRGWNEDIASRTKTSQPLSRHTMTPKRSLSPIDTDAAPDPKRVRVNGQDDTTSTPVEQVNGDYLNGIIVDDGAGAIPWTTPTPHFQARAGIQRSIAMVLAHDGFDSATPEAMESFTQLIETCLCTTNAAICRWRELITNRSRVDDQRAPNARSRCATRPSDTTGLSTHVVTT